jgi:hypothetical protein
MQVVGLIVYGVLTPLPTIFQLYRDGHSVLLVEETGVPEDNHRASCKLNRTFNISLTICIVTHFITGDNQYFTPLLILLSPCSKT